MLNAERDRTRKCTPWTGVQVEQALERELDAGLARFRFGFQSFVRLGSLPHWFIADLDPSRHPFPSLSLRLSTGRSHLDLIRP